MRGCVNIGTVCQEKGGNLQISLYLAAHVEKRLNCAEECGKIGSQHQAASDKDTGMRARFPEQLPPSGGVIRERTWKKWPTSLAGQNVER